jgi:hypothetical protein
MHDNKAKSSSIACEYKKVTAEPTANLARNFRVLDPSSHPPQDLPIAHINTQKEGRVAHSDIRPAMMRFNLVSGTYICSPRSMPGGAIPHQEAVKNYPQRPRPSKFVPQMNPIHSLVQWSCSCGSECLVPPRMANTYCG